MNGEERQYLLLKKQIITLFTIRNSPYIPGYKDIKDFIILNLIWISRPRLYSDYNYIYEIIIHKGLKWVEYLAMRGYDIHFDEEYILRKASQYGYIDIVKYCVEKHRSRIDLKYEYCLRYASLNGHTDIVKYLLEKGANVYKCDGIAIKQACRNGHLDTVKCLVNYGQANLFRYDESIIKKSAKYGYLDMLKYAFELGEDIHTDDHYAIKNAISRGHSHILKYLTERGIDLSKFKNSRKVLNQN